MLKLGEISLKGLNRRNFEKTLANNIKNKLRPHRSTIVSKKGRMYLEVDKDLSDKEIDFALSTLFGLDGYAPCLVSEKNLDSIETCITKAIIGNESFINSATYKVIAKREDKKFEKNSYELSCFAAKIVNSVYPKLKVDVKNPEAILYIEIRNNAYIYTQSKKTLGGLPTGTAGKALSLLSGGIDSPVASVKMASRGLREELVYFHAYPFTGAESLEKVKKLAALIAPYLGGTILHIVNFTPIEMRIKDTVYEREKTIMLRSSMMRVAKKLALKRRCSCLITGEALSQVASQTLSAMEFTTKMADCLVLRPLVGMDKEEIITLSKKIGTYETSILPFEDCCSLFSPKHPITQVKAEQEEKSYTSMDAGKLENEAVETAEMIFFDANGRERVES